MRGYGPGRAQASLFPAILGSYEIGAASSLSHTLSFLITPNKSQFRALSCTQTREKSIQLWHRAITLGCPVCELVSLAKFQGVWGKTGPKCRPLGFDRKRRYFHPLQSKWFSHKGYFPPPVLHFSDIDASYQTRPHKTRFWRGRSK